MKRAKQLCNWLVQPHRRLTNTEDRRGAQLFSCLMLVHFALVSIGINIVNLHYVHEMGRSIWSDQDAWLVLAGLTVIGAAFLLLRQGFYKPAVMIYIIDTAAVALLVPFAQKPHAEIALLASATIPVLLAAMVFSYRWVTGILIGVLAVGITLLPLASIPPRDTEMGLALLIVVAVTGGLILVLRHHLDSLEKERHSQIQEIARKYRDLFDNVADGIFVVDMNGYVVEANPIAYKQLGYTREELIGLPVTSISARQGFDLKRLISRLQVTTSLTYETEHKRKDESTFPVELHLTLTEHQSNTSIIAVARDISERKRAEEALRLSESRFREMADLLPQAIFELDAAGRFTYSNEMGFAATGYTSAELNHGINVLEIFSVCDRERCAANMKLVIAGAHKGASEYTLRRKDGSEFPAIVCSSPIIREGQIVGIRGIAIDITERKRVEEALQQQSRLQELLMNMSNEYLNLPLDAIEAAIRVSIKDMAEYVGADRAYVFDYDFGEQVAKMTHEWCRKGIDARVAKSIPLEQVADLHLQRHLKGEMTWEQDVSALPLGKFRAMLEGRGVRSILTIPCMNSGECLGFVGFTWSRRKHAFSVSEQRLLSVFANMLVNIRCRKRAEEAIQASEQKFRNIAENMFDVIFISNLDSIITYVSPSVEEIFGYSPQELIGRHPYELHPKDEWLRLKEEFRNTFAKEKVLGEALHLIRRDGTLADVEINATPIILDGLVVGGQAIIRDVTETKRLRELESRAQRLETAGQIAGQVAHDFNNMLAPLMAYPELIREQLPEGDPGLKYLEAIEDAAQKIADLNQQLLTLSRRGHYNQEVLSLNAIIQHVLRDMAPLPDTLVIETDLDPVLMNVEGGIAQLHRVVLNLVANARDAMQDIGRISIRTENYHVDATAISYGRIPCGEYAKITISDTGCGITDEVVQRIFDPFFTTKSTDRKRGSGLGLSIVDAVVKDHNGYIDLSTRVGAGTSFYLYFPITRASVIQKPPDEIPCGTETILIVDDDELQRDVSAELLSALGYEVAVCGSGEKAIEMLSLRSYDLLVLDMIMPNGIDGAETYRQALQIRSGQNAIIVSGFSESDRVAEAQKLGAGAFVKKPFDRRVIAHAVQTELDRKEEILVS